MASAGQVNPNHWEVYMGGHEAEDTEVKVEVYMSRALADRLVYAEKEEAITGVGGAVLMALVKSIDRGDRR